VFTAVLIVACPCALALTAPFTLGNMLRIYGRAKFYIKNATVIEQLAKVDTVVFDKTGTITSGNYRPSLMKVVICRTTNWVGLRISCARLTIR
jgi:P-type E1-E2 ATPase